MITEMIATKRQTRPANTRRDISQKLEHDARQKANKNGEPQHMTEVSTNQRGAASEQPQCHFRCTSEQLHGNLRTTFTPLDSNLRAMSKHPQTLKQLEHNLKQPATNRKVAAKQNASNTPKATLKHPESKLEATVEQAESNLRAT